MKFLAVILSLISLPLLAQTDTEFINKTLYPATALLFSQDDSGSMKMLCTVTAIDYKDGAYTFATASHCVSNDDTDHKVAEVEKTFFFVSPDNIGKKEFFKAEVVGAGYQSKGDDFAILKVVTDYKFPVVNLGVDSTKYGDPIVNVASPMGLGRQVLFGNISNPKMDRPVVESEINWTNAVILQLPGTNGGSSGSSVICLDQHAICAFLVGLVGKSSTIAIPVSRFKEFRTEVETGKYKFFKKSEE